MNDINFPSKCQPLRVRAYLQTGVISDQFLPLDAVLYYHAVRKKYGEQHVTIPGQGTVTEYGHVSLPFLRKNIRSEDWYYCCSFAQWPAHTVESQQNYAKRFDTDKSDLIDFKGKVGRVIIERGQFKNYFLKVYYRHALYVDWYVNGVKSEIEALLPFCTHLGKKTAQGWGRVLRWEVTDWPEDWSCKDASGKVMRALPLQTKTGTLYGIRPSYWLPKHQFQCILPA